MLLPNMKIVCVKATHVTNCVMRDRRCPICIWLFDNGVLANERNGIGAPVLLSGLHRKSYFRVNIENNSFRVKFKLLVSRVGQLLSDCFCAK